MPQSTSTRALRFVLRETVGELLYFPVWWYSLGIFTLIRTLIGEWQDVVERLAIRIMIKNLGRPMYADYTRSGRVISFFFRILLLATRLAAVLIWTAVEILIVVLWVVLPVLAAALFIRQFVPV